MPKYRLLNEGEKLKDGDEYYYPIGEGEWKEISKDDLREIIDDCDYPHRRKMKKKKWRLLELGEIVKKGDQFKRYGEWHNASKKVYGDFIDNDFLPYRRRIKMKKKKRNKPCKGLKLLAKYIEALEKEKIYESKNQKAIENLISKYKKTLAIFIGRLPNEMSEDKLNVIRENISWLKIVIKYLQDVSSSNI